MSSPYIGECRLFAGNFAPVGWSTCQGQLIPISENSTLFNLIGTTYGGDGMSTFALPDLAGRTPIHQGDNAGFNFVVGQNGGSETVTITTPQLPIHTHALQASSDNGTTNLVQNAVLAANSGSGADKVYKVTAPNPTLAMNAAAIGNVGGSQPHDNLQPYLTMIWIISLFGIYPSQT